MTVRQIAEITGKTDDAIINRVRKLFPGKEIQHGVPIDLTEEETYRLLKSYEAKFSLPGLSGAGPEKLGRRLPAALLRESRLAVKERLLSVAEARRFLGLDDSTLPAPVHPSLPLTPRDGKALVIGRSILDGQERTERDERRQLPLPLGGTK